MTSPREADEASEHGGDLDDLPPTLLDQAEQFFINYNEMRGRLFKPIARRGAAEAIKIGDAQCESYKEKPLRLARS